MGMFAPYCGRGRVRCCLPSAGSSPFGTPRRDGSGDVLVHPRLSLIPRVSFSLSLGLELMNSVTQFVLPSGDKHQSNLRGPE